jgi:hypothetical protein
VADSYLAARVNALRRAQNPDGGWGYFPGKQSWLEPTLYASLVLHGEAAADKAWSLISSWQQTDGSWRPSAEVQIPHSSSALCVTMAALRGEFGPPFRKGVGWLLSSQGNESSLSKRSVLAVGRWFGLVKDKRDMSLKGWPWKPETASWVEPTSHALIALKKSSMQVRGTELRERVRLGEAMILGVRCADGGWNYGNRTARGEELHSYPETTGIALLGLQGHPHVGPSLDLASRMLSETALPMARAWLRIALRLHGSTVGDPVEAPASPDVLVNALEALGAPGGNYGLLKAEAVA